MPILHWLTRNEDLKAATQVPYRVLEEVPALSSGALYTENMLIQGDNLDALKALLPYYAGQVKCIYIDPPYNTGHAFEHYDDNVEHSTWLSIMYPRLELLREFLSNNGSIWISIDDDEQAYMKVLCDEIFGRENFICSAVWQKKSSPQANAEWLSDSHDFIMVYAKNKSIWRPNLLPRNSISDARYKNPDNDPRGPWTSGDCSVSLMSGQRGAQYAKTGCSSNIYEITTPSGRVVSPPAGNCWRFSKERFERLINKNRIWFGAKGNNVPRVKRFLSDVQDGIVAQTWWTREECGDNQEAKREVKSFNAENIFATPKPERLLQRILTLATQKGDLVMDSFLGSGTTVAVAHKMGRRYVGIEMGDQAQTHCAIRLRQVIEGEQGGISKLVNWQGGGGFRFYKLGEAIFNEAGEINPNVSFAALASHIWFTETYTPLQRIEKKSTFLGIYKKTAYALLYNGVLKDRSVAGGNVLTSKTLAAILEDIGNAEYDRLVVYGECCRLGAATLESRKVQFKQTPYDVHA